MTCCRLQSFWQVSEPLSLAGEFVLTTDCRLVLPVLGGTLHVSKDWGEADQPIILWIFFLLLIILEHRHYFSLFFQSLGISPNHCWIFHRWEKLHNWIDHLFHHTCVGPIHPCRRREGTAECPNSSQIFQGSSKTLGHLGEGFVFLPSVIRLAFLPIVGPICSELHFAINTPVEILNYFFFLPFPSFMLSSSWASTFLVLYLCIKTVLLYFPLIVNLCFLLLYAPFLRVHWKTPCLVSWDSCWNSSSSCVVGWSVLS